MFAHEYSGIGKKYLKTCGEFSTVSDTWSPIGATIITKIKKKEIYF